MIFLKYLNNDTHKLLCKQNKLTANVNDASSTTPIQNPQFINRRTRFRWFSLLTWVCLNMWHHQNPFIKIRQSHQIVMHLYGPWFWETHKHCLYHFTSTLLVYHCFVTVFCPTPTSSSNLLTASVALCQLWPRTRLSNASFRPRRTMAPLVGVDPHCGHGTAAGKCAMLDLFQYSCKGCGGNDQQFGQPCQNNMCAIREPYVQ